MFDKDDDQEKIATSKSRKKAFLKNYGFKFEIPTQYVLDAKTFERDLKYVFRVSKKVLPTK